ncbi:MAG: hypothetical protein K9G41_12780 [Flavobacteriales bacterium]|nr:hypothetical protein [Flavobacteriales bacterium]
MAIAQPQRTSLREIPFRNFVAISIKLVPYLIATTTHVIASEERHEARHCEGGTACPEFLSKGLWQSAAS